MSVGLVRVNNVWLTELVSCVCVGAELSFSVSHVVLLTEENLCGCTDYDHYADVINRLCFYTCVGVWFKKCLCC